MPKSMEEIVSLCKRRGFIFQDSEIYGGQNGFWDYGPLGTLLKRNVRDVWMQDMVDTHNELVAPAGAPEEYQMVGVETADDRRSAADSSGQTTRSASTYPAERRVKSS